MSNKNYDLIFSAALNHIVQTDLLGLNVKHKDSDEILTSDTIAVASVFEPEMYDGTVGSLIVAFVGDDGYSIINEDEAKALKEVIDEALKEAIEQVA